MYEDINALSKESLDCLGDLITKKKLVLFAGSGISVDSNMPSWDDLSHEFVILCKDVFETYKGSVNEEIINHTNNLIAEMPRKQNKNNTLEIISVYRNFLNTIGAKDSDRNRVNEIFKEWFSGLFNGLDYNINHEFIVKTNYPIILTTNYDRLLTEAALKLGFTDLYRNSFGLKTYKDVARCIYEEDSFIFNIHGKAIEVNYDNIVLTKKDYVNIMKNLHNLRMLLETIFIKYAILFVGYGMSDPHLEDLIEEIGFNFNYSEGNVRKFYIVVRKDKVDFIRKNLKKSQGITLLTVDENYNQSKELLKILSEKYPREHK